MNSFNNTGYIASDESLKAKELQAMMRNTAVRANKLKYFKDLTSIIQRKLNGGVDDNTLRIIQRIQERENLINKRRKL